LDPKAMARLSLGEALTNLVWAKVSSVAPASSYVIHLNESMDLLLIYKMAYATSLRSLEDLYLCCPENLF